MLYNIRLCFALVFYESYTILSSNKCTINPRRFLFLHCIFFPKARRANISTVILPEGNRKDFDDLKDYIKQDLDVRFVSDYKEVFDVALI